MSVKKPLCEIYQLATQSLCSDAPLHTRFDQTRHEDIKIMKYIIEEKKDESDEINPEAYDAEELEDTGLTQDEQAGVLHLLHGWIQRNQPNKVRYIQPVSYYYTQAIS